MSKVSNIGYCTYTRIRRNLLINGGHLELIWQWHCAIMNSWTWSFDGEKRNACRILLGKPLAKCPLGKTRMRWKDNIHMVFCDIWCGWGWIVTCCVLCYVWCLTFGFCRRINMTSVFYVYGSVHHNILYEITNRCSYMQSILFHC